jgi:hypothetical protein
MAETDQSFKINYAQSLIKYYKRTWLIIQKTVSYVEQTVAITSETFIKTLGAPRETFLFYFLKSSTTRGRTCVLRFTDIHLRLCHFATLSFSHLISGLKLNPAQEATCTSQFLQRNLDFNEKCTKIFKKRKDWRFKIMFIHIWILMKKVITLYFKRRKGRLFKIIFIYICTTSRSKAIDLTNFSWRCESFIIVNIWETCTWRSYIFAFR